MGSNFYSIKNEMLQLEALATSYHNLPQDIKTKLDITETNNNISGWNQFQHIFADRCMKYSKEEEGTAKHKFVVLFLDNMYLINKIGSIKETIRQLSESTEWQAQKLIMSNNQKAKEETLTNITQNKEDNSNTITNNVISLSSDSNSGGRITTQGCSPTSSGSLIYSGIGFPTDTASQNINKNEGKITNTLASTNSGFVDTKWNEKYTSTYIDVNPAQLKIAQLNYELPELRKRFWNKFNVLFY